MPDIQNFTYHCHTNFSDGRNSIGEMLLCAKDLGFSEIGVSDHLMVHKNMQQSKSAEFWRQQQHAWIFYDDFQKILPMYQRHCENLRRKAKELNIKLYVGFEVDFFTYDGWLEEFKEFITQLDYDYLISGNHMFFDESGEDLFDINYFRYMNPDAEMAKDYLHRHFQTIEKAVQSGVFKFLAHLDYARKLGEAVCSADSFKGEKTAILEALQNQNVGMEISTKGLRKIGDFYPCGWILDEAAKRNIKMVISDDAHKIEELGMDFAKAESALLAHNIKNRMKF
ncbi:MAG: histidinol-phosphatase HisJ family protein [Alphaproteobacteria bacterium]|nr:histidinol-phosphatase HisJ family protein [Alphaproteobacteria bacterium]